MPDKITKAKKPRKPTLHIRKISADLIERVNGTAGHIGMDRDVLATTILEKALGRFKPARTEAKEWFESFTKSKD